MKGYYMENNIDEYDVKQIPIFLKLREIIVYRGIHRNLNIDNLKGWTKDYIMQSKSRIEKQIPLITNIL